MLSFICVLSLGPTAVGREVKPDSRITILGDHLQVTSIKKCNL